MALVITKKIKDLFKTRGLKTSQDAIDAINKEVEKLCLKAADRVVADKLKTVKSGHVPKVDAVLSSE